MIVPLHPHTLAYFLPGQLLRREQLDLRLTPYKVLALGPYHGMCPLMPSLAHATLYSRTSCVVSGMVEFIDSVPVAEVLEKHNSIQVSVRVGPGLRSAAMFRSCDAC